MSGTYGFLVTPEKLMETAEEMEKETEKLNKNMQELLELSRKTQNCFKGIAGERFRSCFKRKAAGEEINLEKLKAFPGQLLSIAAEYAKAEGENRDVADRN